MLICLCPSLVYPRKEMSTEHTLDQQDIGEKDQLSKARSKATGVFSIRAACQASPDQLKRPLPSRGHAESHCGVGLCCTSRDDHLWKQLAQPTPSSRSGRLVVTGSAMSIAQFGGAPSTRIL